MSVSEYENQRIRIDELEQQVSQLNQKVTNAELILDEACGMLREGREQEARFLLESGFY